MQSSIQQDQDILFDARNLNSGDTITVKPSKEFTIKFAANPTTGFNWYMENAEELKQKQENLKCTNLNEEFTGTYQRKEKKDREMMGVGGHTYFNFLPQLLENQTDAKVNLQFKYKRLWEKNNDSENNFILNVNITDKNNVKDL